MFLRNKNWSNKQQITKKSKNENKNKNEIKIENKNEINKIK